MYKNILRSNGTKSQLEASDDSRDVLTSFTSLFSLLCTLITSILYYYKMFFIIYQFTLVLLDTNTKFYRFCIVWWNSKQNSPIACVSVVCLTLLIILTKKFFKANLNKLTLLSSKHSCFLLPWFIYFLFWLLLCIRCVLINVSTAFSFLWLTITMVSSNSEEIFFSMSKFGRRIRHP